MKKPEEIKKGLKLCSHEGHGEEIICEHCPYDNNSCAILICTRRLSEDSLAYIQQLEAELKSWKAEAGVAQKALEITRQELEAVKRERDAAVKDIEYVISESENMKEEKKID